MFFFEPSAEISASSASSALQLLWDQSGARNTEGVGLTMRAPLAGQLRPECSLEPKPFGLRGLVGRQKLIEAAPELDQLGIRVRRDGCRKRLESRGFGRAPCGPERR